MTSKSYSNNEKERSERANGTETMLQQEIRRAVKTDDQKLIDELGDAATPRQIRTWITRLEGKFAQKKENARSDVQQKVKEIIDSNGYTLEELLGARVLPTTDELAELANSHSQ